MVGGDVCGAMAVVTEIGRGRAPVESPRGTAADDGARGAVQSAGSGVAGRVGEGHGGLQVGDACSAL